MATASPWGPTHLAALAPVTKEAAPELVPVKSKSKQKPPQKADLVFSVHAAALAQTMLWDGCSQDALLAALAVPDPAVRMLLAPVVRRAAVGRRDMLVFDLKITAARECPKGMLVWLTDPDTGIPTGVTREATAQELQLVRADRVATQFASASHPELTMAAMAAVMHEGLHERVRALLEEFVEPMGDDFTQAQWQFVVGLVQSGASYTSACARGVAAFPGARAESTLISRLKMPR